MEDNIIKSLDDKLEKGIISQEVYNKIFSQGLIKGGEGSKGGKVIGHTATGKPIYVDKNDPHQFMGIHSRNDNHGSESRKVTLGVRKLSNEDLDKFHKHHKEHGKFYLDHSEESEKLNKEDRKKNPSNESGYTDRSDDNASHYEAAKAAEREIQRRKDGGAADRQFRNDSRADARASSR